jgi:hypothetical protein
MHLGIFHGLYVEPVVPLQGYKGLCLSRERCIQALSDVLTTVVVCLTASNLKVISIQTRQVGSYIGCFTTDEVQCYKGITPLDRILWYVVRGRSVRPGLERFCCCAEGEFMYPDVTVIPCRLVRFL